MSVEQKVAILFIMSFPAALRVLLIMLAIGIYFVVRNDRIKRTIVAGWLILCQFALLFSLGSVSDGAGYTAARIHGTMSPTQTSQDSLTFMLLRWERVVLPNFGWTIALSLVNLFLAFFIAHQIHIWYQREFLQPNLTLKGEI